MPPSPDKIPTDPFFFSKCLKISWCMCFMYYPGTFETATSILGLKVVKFVGGSGLSHSLLDLPDISFTGPQN